MPTGAGAHQQRFAEHMTVGSGQDIGLGCSLWLTAGAVVRLELVKMPRCEEGDPVRRSL